LLNLTVLSTVLSAQSPPELFTGLKTTAPLTVQTSAAVFDADLLGPVADSSADRAHHELLGTFGTSLEEPPKLAAGGGPEGAGSPVPEPTTLLLVGSGIVGLAFTARQNRRRRLSLSHVPR